MSGLKVYSKQSLLHEFLWLNTCVLIESNFSFNFLIVARNSTVCPNNNQLKLKQKVIDRVSSIQIESHGRNKSGANSDIMTPV